MDVNGLTRSVIGACIEVHREMGPGLLESVYEECLVTEFELRGIPYQRQQAINLEYKGRSLESEFRLDFFINKTVILELKTVDRLLPIHEAQVLSYLRLTNTRIGLLINFKTSLLKNGIKRLANNYQERNNRPNSNLSN